VRGQCHNGARPGWQPEDGQDTSDWPYRRHGRARDGDGRGVAERSERHRRPDGLLSQPGDRMKIKSKPPGKIRAAILTWLGFTPDYFGQVPASDETAGEAMNADAMLRLSAAWAC